jgi:hypothetical protein
MPLTGALGWKGEVKEVRGRRRNPRRQPRLQTEKGEASAGKKTMGLTGGAALSARERKGEKREAGRWVELGRARYWSERGKAGPEREEGRRGGVGPRGSKQGKEEKVGHEKRKRSWVGLKAGKGRVWVWVWVFVSFFFSKTFFKPFQTFKTFKTSHIKHKHHATKINTTHTHIYFV